MLRNHLLNLQLPFWITRQAALCIRGLPSLGGVDTQVLGQHPMSDKALYLLLSTLQNIAHGSRIRFAVGGVDGWHPRTSILE